MSIFKESAWETDETGDKLTKEFLSDKKVGPKEKTRKNVGKRKKKAKIVQSDTNSAATTNQNESGVEKVKKKRKGSEITIDQDIIKKWKTESMKPNISRGKTKEPKNNSKEKEIRNTETKTGNSKEPVSTKGSVAKISDVEKVNSKREVNNSVIHSDQCAPNSSTSDVKTKSQIRRLRRKQKLSHSTAIISKINGTGDGSKHFGNEVENSVGNISRTVNKKGSTITKNSKDLRKAPLHIDKIHKLLAAKQDEASKTSNGNLSTPKSLRDRMLARLKSSRFRFLNEQMYNSESWSSRKYFKEDPDAFTAYHEGYKLQVEQWPLNPLDNIISSIKRMPKDYVVADFGCGEARLAESVAQKVHSLDLVAINDRVTACDMAHTSLLTARIDVVVFCLSLMGTNLADYVKEANRVLRKDGILKIAEVESRFEDVDGFVKTLGSYGFVNTSKDLSHSLFYFMDFKKEADVTKKRNKLPPITLKACLYKKR
ncbi:ribosomal RNA-processing protein 8 isoform X1 [Athalia rosae]|uniref:ribosomal RNA-processing protein 8 isoform X1 n=1 Tax=Athalia rosae TaxID=37344 RepID=UPI002033A550|nr:ribosomal RNA-processing protein 8 isoform X1 [Athalia rosae]